ncbi:MAG: MFS transporter [Promethearchaeota archaeon]
MTKEKETLSETQEFKDHRILSLGEAIIYVFPNLGLTAVLGICVSFTLLFYINIMGQPAIIIGGIYSAALFLYAFICIFGGVIADRIGKKKVLLISGPIIAITFIFLWIPPIPNTSFGIPYFPLIIWLLLFSFIFRIMIGFFQPTFYSLLPELSTDEQNRVKISMVNMMAIIIGTIIGTMIPIFLMGDATQGLSKDNPELYYLTSDTGRKIYSQILGFSIIICILFIILFTIMLIVIKEPEKKISKEPILKEVINNFSEPLKDNNYRLFLITFFLIWVPFVAFQYLILSLATFVLKLRGSEFFVMAAVAFLFAILSFVLWQKLSKKHGLKKTFTICLIFASISFFSVLILLIPMPTDILFILGMIFITFCLCSLVGTMIFPFAIMSDIIDSAELKKNKSLSGSYSGAFTMTGSLAGGTAMLIISICLEIYGPESPISYGFILAIGAFFIVIAIFLFQKIKITGTKKKVN